MEEKRSTRERLLEAWGHWTAKHWGKTIIIGLAITVFLTFGAGMLRLNMTYYSIMPEESIDVRNLKHITEEFPYASAITVVVDGRDIEDPRQAEERVKKTVDALMEEFGKAEYKPLISNVTGKMDLDFFRDHGLMLTKAEDIRRFANLYHDLDLGPFFTALNDDFEREYAGNEENLQDDEETAVAQFRGLDRMFGMLADAGKGKEIPQDRIEKVLDDFLLGQPYFLSHDNRMALLMVEPTFTINDIETLVTGVNTIEARAKEIAADAGVKAGLTGLTTIGRDEMVTSEQGLVGSMLIAVFLILLLIVFSFRMFSSPLISGIPLMIGIYWAVGLTGFTIHRMNIMTAMYMVALVGLGIDYAIHLLTTFVQERDDGVPFIDAVGASFRKSGSGIITGALTTAVAFFALQVSETALMRELGLVAGLGILSELAAMFLLVPALLGIRERHRLRTGKKESRIFRKIYIRTDLAGGFGRWVEKMPVLIVILAILLCLGLATGAGRVTIQQNMMEMEAKGLESIKLQDTLVEEFDMAPDGLYVFSKSLEDVKDLETRLKDLDSVKRIESVAPFMVSSSEYGPRKHEMEAFRSSLEGASASTEVDGDLLLDEIYRLEMNLVELDDMAFLGGMQRISHALNEVTGRDDQGRKVEDTKLDGLISLLEEDPGSAVRLADFQSRFVPVLKDKLLRMSSTDRIELSDLPNMFRDAYVSSDGKEFLLMIVPTRNPWEEDFRNIFTTQVASVTDHATGMILASNVLNDMAQSDSTRAGIAALAAIFLILLLDFHNLKLVLLTMFPLLCSFGALFGVMGYTGIEVDFINIIAFPLLIGIGVDDAVHISHRYRIEGRGGIARAVAKTGTAVLLTSVTTIIAFGSFIPSPMRAMKSTGIVLPVAIGFAFLFSIILHPAMLQLTAERFNLNIRPWKSGKRRQL